MTPAISYDERTGHLPQLIEDLIIRLLLGNGAQAPEPPQPTTTATCGFSRGTPSRCWYEESRLLQVSLFDTLRLNQKSLDLNSLMADV